MTAVAAGATDRLETLGERIRAASSTARDHADSWQAEIERRDQLIVDGIREGLGYRKVMELSQLSRTRIIAILADRG